MEIADRLEELRWLKERADLSTKVAKERKARFQSAQAELYHYMQRNGLDGVTSHGYTFALRSTTLSNVNNKEAFEEWLRTQEGEDVAYEDFIRTEPQKARLNELVRDAIDRGAPLPPGVNAYANEYISITER